MIEAAGLAKPVLFGPHTDNFRDITDELLARNAARCVADAEGLHRTLRELLSDPASAFALGARAREAVDHHRGATRRTLDALESFLTVPAQ